MSVVTIPVESVGSSPVPRGSRTAPRTLPGRAWPFGPSCAIINWASPQKILRLNTRTSQPGAETLLTGKLAAEVDGIATEWKKYADKIWTENGGIPEVDTGHHIGNNHIMYGSTTVSKTVKPAATVKPVAKTVVSKVVTSKAITPKAIASKTAASKTSTSKTTAKNNAAKIKRSRNMESTQIVNM